jgi:hypothetical protein
VSTDQHYSVPWTRSKEVWYSHDMYILHTIGCNITFIQLKV